MNRQIRRAILSQIEFGKRCLKLLDRAPSTSEDYKEAFDEVDAGVRLNGAIAPDSYSRKWIKRGFLRLLMQSQGITLTLKGLSIRNYIACFPDQQKRLLPLLTDTSRSQCENLARPVSAALKTLDYTDALELLSMHACLLDNFDAQCILRSKEVGWCNRNLRIKQMTMREYKKKQRIWPHPAILFHKCRHLE